MADEEIVVVIEEGSDIVVVTPVNDNIEFITIDNGTIGPRGPEGPRGPAGNGSLETIAYTYVQAVPSSKWSIQHPLNFTPNVVSVDSAGSEQIGTVTYGSAGLIEIEFGAAFSGTAYLS